MTEPESTATAEFYCPKCNRAVADPLVCGDCAAMIYGVCGTPLAQSSNKRTSK